MANDLGACATTRDQLKGIDEDGLTGSGLAGEDCESRAQLELDGVDDREVADLQIGEH